MLPVETRIRHPHSSIHARVSDGHDLIDRVRLRPALFDVRFVAPLLEPSAMRLGRARRSENELAPTVPPLAWRKNSRWPSGGRAQLLG